MSETTKLSAYSATLKRYRGLVYIEVGLNVTLV